MVDQAVCLGVFSRHKAIPVGVFFHRFKGLARVVARISLRRFFARRISWA